MRETQAKPRLLVLVASLALAAASLLAALAVFAAKARAGSFDSRPPKAVLMKGATVLQADQRGSFCWSFYDEGGGNWKCLCADTTYMFPRAHDFLRAGTRLHIRLGKPERPEKFMITAYEGFDKGQTWPIGKGRRLDTNLRRVERDGKTVAWNVFLRVNEPDRHYYLDTIGLWESVPGTHTSSRDASYSFHVRTR